MSDPRRADTSGMDTNNPASIKSIEIFRPGTFTAANGQQYSFTPAQVQELADTYNPAFSDAPFVVGHPKMTSPRFGRAGRLFVNDSGVLCAEPADVVPEFAAAVNARQYPKVSASIFLPGAPNNPTPGKHYLRHVGFLGGVAPAVKGLEMVEFASSPEGVVDFGYEDRVMVSLFRSMRDWFIESLGLEKAQQIIPDYSIGSLESSIAYGEATDSQAGGPIPAFSDPTQPTEAELSQQAAIAAQAEQNKTKEEALAAREAALAAKEAKANEASIASFAEGLSVEGKLLPAQKAQVVEILKQLNTVNLVADFAAGDANHGKTGADLFKDFLSAQPKLIEFDRVSKAGAAEGAAVDFASPAGAEVDQEGLLLLGRAQQYQRENPGVDIVAAAKAVSGG